jgi:kinesin family protein C1
LCWAFCYTLLFFSLFFFFFFLPPVDTHTHAVTELEASRAQLSASNAALHTELESTRARLASTTSALDDERRSRALERDDLARHARLQLDAAQQAAHAAEARQQHAHADELRTLQARLERELADARAQHAAATQQLADAAAAAQQRAQAELDTRERELRQARADAAQADSALAQERALAAVTRASLADAAHNALRLEAALGAARAQVERLEAEARAETARADALQARLDGVAAERDDAHARLRQEEALRRRLHNQVQELKGNIRVFCRVRPALRSEPATDAARIAFPDTESERREIEVYGGGGGGGGGGSGGNDDRSGGGGGKRSAFAFDRVFGPGSDNAEVFGEISQLVQSALDGYNVCIFCYGQTGSGKTHTMSAPDGLIPRTVQQIYETTQRLRDKGWHYELHGSFIEVYNEQLHDLLLARDGHGTDDCNNSGGNGGSGGSGGTSGGGGSSSGGGGANGSGGTNSSSSSSKRLEIRHDAARGRTHVPDLTVEPLDSPARAAAVLRRAAGNRSVAATRANERSSRSHCVFMLRLAGANAATGERCDGTLNLVDLAGSERLSQSGSTGERLRETQNINRSLSCLGDVISALGQGKEGGHVPYRNSKVKKKDNQKKPPPPSPPLQFPSFVLYFPSRRVRVFGANPFPPPPLLFFP